MRLLKTRLLRNHLLRLVVQRVMLIPLSLFAILIASYGLIELMPGDPAQVVAGDFATSDEIEDARHRLGLDQPLLPRMYAYMGRTLRGDLGRSFTSNRPVRQDIFHHLPRTIELMGAGVVVAALLGLLLGGLSAYFRGRLLDRIARIVITITQSIPDFLLALLLIYIFYLILRVAPAPVGQISFGADIPGRSGFMTIDALISGQWSALADVVAHMALPVATLGCFYSALFAKTVRATLGAALASPQVEFARACGLRERQVIYYAFLDTRASVLTYFAIMLGSVGSGAAIVEQIFAWPGLGRWALNAMFTLDFPAIRGFILVTGAITMLVYVVLDVTLLILDPRIRRYGG